MAVKKYSYYDKNDKQHFVELPEALDNQAKQALQHYESGKKYFFTRQYHSVRQALKAYHLSTYDRKVFLGERNAWKSNISIGMTRSFVDIFTSAVNERPLTFVGTPINKKGLENKKNIINTLEYISDISGFHMQIKEALKSGLMFGTIALRVNYMKTEKKTEIISIVNDEETESVVTVDDSEIKDYPTATNLSLFNVFPDPYNGTLRYITERGVVSHYEFKQLFSNIIKRADNKSPFKTDEFINLLPYVKNQNGADYTDFGSIVDIIHQKINEENALDNKYQDIKNEYTYTHVSNTYDTPDKDPKVTDGMIEFLITTENDVITIHANNYPVYIGPNFYGFINYVWKNAGNNKLRYGEGVPYLLNGIEKTATSFVNNHIDGARITSTPTFVSVKNLLINEGQLEGGNPGATLWINGTAGSDSSKAITRLDKGTVSDSGTYQLLFQLGQQITGISEYNLGISAGERTATGSLAVSQSSQKRISPYISSFVDAISEVANMWLSLVKQNWVKERYIYVNDEDGEKLFTEMQNNKLLGGINISLQAEGMFGSTNALEQQQLNTMYQTIAKSPNINANEIEKEIIEKAGFSSDRFMIHPEEQPSSEQMEPEQKLITSQVGVPTLDTSTTQESTPTAMPTLQQILQQSTNSQPNYGNKGKGQ